MRPARKVRWTPDGINPVLLTTAFTALTARIDIRPETQEAWIGARRLQLFVLKV
jgi:hypothetical protein